MLNMVLRRAVCSERWLKLFLNCNKLFQMPTVIKRRKKRRNSQHCLRTSGKLALLSLSGLCRKQPEKWILKWQLRCELNGKVWLTRKVMSVEKKIIINLLLMFMGSYLCGAGYPFEQDTHDAFLPEQDIVGIAFPHEQDAFGALSLEQDITGAAFPFECDGAVRVESAMFG